MPFLRYILALVGLLMAVLPQPRQALADAAIHAPDNPGLAGILSEARGGVLYHDAGLITSRTESGADINAEVLFTSPEFLSFAFSPRPHLGVSANTSGDTSQLYFGLSWTADIYESFFAELTFGGSVHNGKRNSNTAGRNDLGCRLLFRESISVGVIVGTRHSISLMLDHISNADLCDRNHGQDTVGIRYGIRF